MLDVFYEYKWEIIIGCALGLPLLFYLSGYFWTRGMMNAKSEFLNQELKNINYNNKEKKE